MHIQGLAFVSCKAGKVDGIAKLRDLLVGIAKNKLAHTLNEVRKEAGLLNVLHLASCRIRPAQFVYLGQCVFYNTEIGYSEFLHLCTGVSLPAAIGKRRDIGVERVQGNSRQGQPVRPCVRRQTVRDGKVLAQAG